MADLEDFFAKRDKKKKSKTQKSETSTSALDDVAKILDAKVKERKKQETNKSTYQVPVSENPDQVPTDYRAQEDDEWKELVEEKPDYTGLKIQELILEDEDENTGKDTNGQDDGIIPKEGPWRKDKKAATPVPAPTPAPVPVVEPESEEPVPAPEVKSADPDVETPDTLTITETETPKESEQPKKYVPAHVRAREEAAAKAGLSKGPTPATPAPLRPPTDSASTPSAPAPKLASGAGGAYVPPSQRGGLPSSTTSSGSKPKKQVAAPNINSEVYFPSLGS